MNTVIIARKKSTGWCLQRRSQNLVLAPEAGQGPDAGQAQRGDEEGGVGPGHDLAQPAHLSHIEGAGGVVDAARAQEEQSLEEGVVEEVEDADGDAPHPQPQHHVAELADGGVGQHALDIGHHQPHGGGEDGGEAADDGHRGQGLRWSARNSGKVRATRKTPAATIVAAWMRALTGVGPSMASGSQTWSGNWADLPAAPAKMPMAAQVRVVPARAPGRSPASEAGRYQRCRC